MGSLDGNGIGVRRAEGKREGEETDGAMDEHIDARISRDADRQTKLGNCYERHKMHMHVLKAPVCSGLLCTYNRSCRLQGCAQH